MNSIIIFVILLIFVLVIRFVIDNNKQKSSIKAVGGMRTKYATLVNACLQSSNSKILQEMPTFISIGGELVEQGIHVNYAFWIQHTFNNKLNVKYILKVPNTPQKTIDEWNFEQTADQELMVKCLSKYIDELTLSRTVKNQSNNDNTIHQTTNNIKEYDIDNLQQATNHLHIAHDVPDKDRVNDIFLKAKNMARKLSNTFYTHLSSDGLLEALIYCSILLVDLKDDYTNTIDTSKLEDKYFLLLSDEIIMHSTNEVGDTIDFLNNRISFYKTIANTLTHLDEDELRKVYYYFFINPLCVKKPNFNDKGNIVDVQLNVLRLSLIVTAMNQQTEYYNGLP